MIKLFAVLFVISMQAISGELSTRNNEEVSYSLENNGVNYWKNGAVIQWVSDETIENALVSVLNGFLSEKEFMHRYPLKEIYKQTEKIYITDWEHEQHDSVLRDGKNIYPPSVLKRVGLKYKSGTNILVEDNDPLLPKTLKEIWQDDHFQLLTVLTIGGNIVFNLMLKNLVYFTTDKLCKKPTTRQSVEEYNKFRNRTLMTTRILFNVAWFAGAALVYNRLIAKKTA